MGCYMVITVGYSIGTYQGTVDVFADGDAEDDHVFAMARRKLREQSGGSLPFGAQSFTIIDKREV